MINKIDYTPEEQRLVDDLNALAILDLPQDAMIYLRDVLNNILTQRHSLRSAQVLDALTLLLGEEDETK